MVSSNDSKPFRELVKASEAYLGPAGERFVRRQIYTHLDKEPESINRRDIHILIEWLQPAFALITNDSEIIDSYVATLEKLAKQKTVQKGRHGRK